MQPISEFPTLFSIKAVILAWMYSKLHKHFTFCICVLRKMLDVWRGETLSVSVSCLPRNERFWTQNIQNIVEWVFLQSYQNKARCFSYLSDIKEKSQSLKPTSGWVNCNWVSLFQVKDYSGAWEETETNAFNSLRSLQLKKSSVFLFAHFLRFQSLSLVLFSLSLYPPPLYLYFFPHKAATSVYNAPMTKDENEEIRKGVGRLWRCTKTKKKAKRKF